MAASASPVRSISPSRCSPSAACPAGTWRGSTRSSPTGKRTVVNLAEPLPIHITYLTAWVDQGIPNFRSDIYGQDEKLLAALDGQSLSW